MNDMINNFIESISRQLNIPKTNEAHSICNVVYSAAGQLALASLWDHSDYSDSISIQHFKNRIVDVFDAYESLFPFIKSYLPQDKSVLCDEMYSIYLRSGYFYHYSHQISPAISASAVLNNVQLSRGHSPDEQYFMSGLGFYSISKFGSNRTVPEMFDLQQQSFENYLSELLSYSEWEDVTWPETAEFLRLDPPFSKGYWQNTPTTDNRISLARYGEPNKLLVLYRYSNGRYQQKPIPEWRIKDYFINTPGSLGEYRRVAVALLKQYGVLPKITAKEKDQLIEIRVGYRLPPSEEVFFKLYSWPMFYNFSESTTQVFTRKMSKLMYPVFKDVLENIGYCFVEE